MNIKINNTDLEAAVEQGWLRADQLPQLWEFLLTRQAAAPVNPTRPDPDHPTNGNTRDTADGPRPARFDLSHVLWYAGALVVMGAMGMFSTYAFLTMGGTALSATGLLYGLVFIALGSYLWHTQKLYIPGGLLITIAVTMVPLIIFGIQSQSHWWMDAPDPGVYRDFFIWAKAGWIIMEVGTIVATLIALWFFPFPFLVAIASVAAWFMSMDLGAWVAGTSTFADSNWLYNENISIAFGVVLIVLAAIVDRRLYKNGDFAFWLHLFGMLILWGVLTSSHNGDAVAQALYCVLNVVFIGLSLFFMRPVYAVFGALGVAAYLGELSMNWFADSLLFPFALSVIGIAIIALGLLYHRKQAVLADWLDTRLPRSVQALRPIRARAAAGRLTD